MAQDKNFKQEQPKPNRQWIGWVAVVIFIVGTIAFLLAIDAVYAPQASDPTELPDTAPK